METNVVDVLIAHGSLMVTVISSQLDLFIFDFVLSSHIINFKIKYYQIIFHINCTVLQCCFKMHA